MELTQQERILTYLRAHKEGLNSYFATYSLNIKQAPTRILELKKLGNLIVSTNNPDRSVTWQLVSEATKKAEIRHQFMAEDYIFTKDGRAILRQEPVQGGLF